MLSQILLHPLICHIIQLLMYIYRNKEADLSIFFMHQNTLHAPNVVVKKHVLYSLSSGLLRDLHVYSYKVVVVVVDVDVVCRLLDLLADRKDKAGKSGMVLINGQRRQPNYKTMVGYVVQVKTTVFLCFLSVSLCVHGRYSHGDTEFMVCRL